MIEILLSLLHARMRTSEFVVRTWPKLPCELPLDVSLFTTEPASFSSLARPSNLVNLSTGDPSLMHTQIRALLV